MKSVLTVFVFTICFIIYGCDNDQATANDNNLDSVGATDSPSATGVLTDDTAYLKNADTTNQNH